MSQKLLRLGAVSERTGKPRSSIYAAVAAGQFPAPVPIGIRSVAWVEREISEWIEGQIAKRGEGA